MFKANLTKNLEVWKQKCTFNVYLWLQEAGNQVITGRLEYKESDWCELSLHIH